jgi:hypothetical protein
MRHRRQWVIMMVVVRWLMGWLPAAHVEHRQPYEGRGVWQ